jgi:hypothetical protein
VPHQAVGAVIAQVSGEVDQVFQDLWRDEAIARARQAAEDKAVAAGADPATISVVEVEDLPLANLPGNSLRTRSGWWEKSPADGSRDRRRQLSMKRQALARPVNRLASSRSRPRGGLLQRADMLGPVARAPATRAAAAPSSARPAPREVPGRKPVYPLTGSRDFLQSSVTK